MRRRLKRVHAITLSLLFGLCLAGLSVMLVRPPASRAAAILTVTSTADSGPGTLRQAILNAADGDTVNFALPANSTITLTSGVLSINKSVTINGPGANLLTVQRGGSAGNFRVLDILRGNLTISGLTITNGKNIGGMGGGGIFSQANDLIIRDCTISGNSADSGGGIYNAIGTLTIINTTISGNSSIAGSGAGGGGIYNSLSGVVGIINSTLSGNSAKTTGGAIFNDSTLILVSSTISGNTTLDNSSPGSSVGGAIYTRGPLNLTSSTIASNTSGIGGGLYISPGAHPLVTTRDSIIAANSVVFLFPDVAGAALTSQGYNLIGTPPEAVTPTATDRIGTAAVPINPLLGPLQDNGGPTFTHALLLGSPATDRGLSGDSSTGPSPDQRGFARPLDSPVIANASGGDGSDIGAYEVQADQLPGCSTINLVVNNNNDSGPGSLRDVMANVCAGSTITFAPNVRGVITLTSGQLQVNKSLTISGPGANLLTVRRSTAPGTANFRIFLMNTADLITTISGLTIANGNPGAASAGALYNAGRLTIINNTISGNSAVESGAIRNDGTMTIINSTISGNSSFSSNGAIRNDGAMTIINSTISGNSSAGGNGAGGIFNDGTMTITNCTITGNSATNATGGGGGLYAARTVEVGNTIIALNTALNGPDIYGTIASRGFNLIGDVLGAAIVPTQPSDLIGISRPPGSPINPLLGPLQNNGGPTFTHALLFGSPAIDKGHSSTSTTDQRGLPRPLDLPNANASGGDGSDIGAFEAQTAPTPTPTPTPNVVQFSSSNYSVQEDCTTVTITVNRVGDASGAISVDYSTSDVSASERRDYITALGKLTFAPGETLKSFAVLINEDSYVEGNETFNVNLSNPSGASLGASIATVTITDDASEPAANMIDDPQTFVCQHYHDFLNRAPDASGLAFWTNEITSCGADQVCIELKRLNVSGAYFLSIEFQQTGYLVERLYKAAYGNASGTSTVGVSHQLAVPIVRLNEFLPDTQEIGQGVVVGQPGWEQVLENNKQAFISGFVQRSRFTNTLPVSLTPAQFVDALNANAGNPLSQSERNQLVTDLTTNAKNRPQVLRAVAEDADLVSGESTRAFVLMQFFGYLRRNPNDPQDTDYTGYDFWLTKLNQFNGNFVNADMVKAFISSSEYRQRFGP